MADCLLRAWIMLQVLMCRPIYFDVPEDDGENNYMDPANRPDTVRALQEHRKLVCLYRKLGISVSFIEPAVADLPDMTFTANLGFTFERFGRRAVILSNFKPKRRREEKRHFQSYFKDIGYAIYTLPNNIFFEGAGDALSFKGRILLGHGFRTDVKAARHLEFITGREVVPLALKPPGAGRKNPYHLDTTLILLEDADTIILHREAFTSAALKELEKLATLVPASRRDAEGMALNALVVPIKDVVVDPSCYTYDELYPSIGDRLLAARRRERGVVITSSLAGKALLRAISKRGYIPLTVDLFEFLKSGAGAFCLTKVL